MPEMLCPRKLLRFAQVPKRFKIAIGGRGSGKSQTFADLNLKDVQTQGLKTGCFREFQNSIEDSVYSLLVEEIYRLELTGFDVREKKILYNGQEAFKFRGLARNIDSIQSMSGFRRFWVEEGQNTSYRSLKKLTPTLRVEDSEIWMSGNPQSRADPFSQRFIVPYEKELLKNGYYEDDLHLIVLINYKDNPFFPKVLERERAHDERTLSRAEYNHIWLGAFNDTVANAIIPVEWFDVAIDAHEKLGFKPRGAKVASFDPSDQGPDPKGFAYRHGNVFFDVRENEQGDSNEGCDWATDLARERGVDLFTWDCDGLGVSLSRQVYQSFKGTKIQVQQFKGSHTPDDPEQVYQQNDQLSKSQQKTNRQTFKNKRAQYYWRLRDLFYNTYRAVVKGEYIDPDELISLSSEIDCLDELRAEVCRIPKVPGSHGLIQIMSKIDMKNKLHISSPNMADCLMMSLVNPERLEVDNSDIEFSSFW